MRLTVAICTWNRAHELDRALGSLAACDRPADFDLEVLVVNNRCTDHTDAVIERHTTHLPLRRLWQQLPGLSNARNAAIDAATGDYILWTDDDVLLDRGWLLGYARAVQTRPDAAFFGGPIEPVFDGGMPDWIRAGWTQVGCAYAERDLGPEPFQLRGANNLPFGANMALRAIEQRQWRYDPHMGRRPGAGLLGGDEIEIFRSMLDSGAEGWWVPDARVQHCIGPDRQTLNYLQRYFEGDGMLAAIMRPPAVGRRIFGRPPWLWRSALWAALRYRVLKAFRGPEHWLPALVKAAKARGRLLRTMSPDFAAH